MNQERNLLGRVLALALLAGAAYGVRSIARGTFCCASGAGNSCEMALPAGDAKTEKFDADNGAAGEEDAKLEKKAPVAPPAAKK